MVDKYQDKDKYLVDKIKFSNYRTKFFCGGRKVILLIRRSEILLFQKYFKIM